MTILTIIALNFDESKYVRRQSKQVTLTFNIFVLNENKINALLNTDAELKISSTKRTRTVMQYKIGETGVAPITLDRLTLKLNIMSDKTRDSFRRKNRQIFF